MSADSRDLELVLDEFDPEATFARDVAREVWTQRVRQAAREKIAREREGEGPPFDAGLLGDVLARPQDPPHRVEGLIPSDAATLVVAQRKTGKTTLLLNLARCLLTGDDFLGRFPVRPLSGRVAFLNYEVSGQQLARWAAEVGVDRTRLLLVNLRGRRNPLNHTADRAALARLLHEHDVETLIVDPFGRAYGGTSQNDPGEVGSWLTDLDAFARSEAGVADLLLAAHAGWDGERTRGSSALEDWADSIVTLVRDKDDQGGRYLRAEGRDVLVEEDALAFDPATRTLTLAGAGSRRTAAKVRQLEPLRLAARDLLAEHGPLTGYQLDNHLRALIDSGALDARLQKGDGARAAQLLERVGLVAAQPGARNSTIFTLTSPISPAPPRGDVPTTSPTSLIGGGGEVGRSATSTSTGEVGVR